MKRTNPQPPVSADERIAHLVRRAARSFSRALQIRLAENDVSFGHWIFLRILWEQDGLTQVQLSELADLTEPTTHTALQRLEALGYVVRKTLPGNKRKQHTFLTPAGKALRKKLEPLAIEVNEVALKGLSAKDEELLRTILRTIIANLQEDEEEGIALGRKMPPTRMRVNG